VRRKISRGESLRMASMYESGMTIREIMAKLGRAYGSVYGALFREGVQMRPKGAQPRKR